MNFPNPIFAIGLGRVFWAGPARKGKPKKGDWYVSGAIPEAYRATNDLDTEYWIIQPTHYARQTVAWERSDAIRFTPGGVPLPKSSIREGM
jgi:hypothetical protein